MRPAAAPAPLPLRPRPAFAPLGGSGFYVYLRAVTFKYCVVMSKSNMLLGLAKGKVGDLVFYRDGGEQRTRTRVVPKNPRSAAQMGQRVRLANVPAFYRTMQAIMKDSFSNRPSNQSGYNAFAKGAIEVSPFLTKEMALAGSVLPAPYMVSRGVITSPEFGIDDTTGVLYPSVIFPAGTDRGGTVGQASSTLLSVYPQLQQGDILTFVAVSFSVDELADGANTYRASVATKQFVIDTTSSASMPTAEWVAGVPSLTPIMRSAEENVAVAVIVSRKLADGTLQTSTAALEMDEAASTLYEGYRTEQALNEAITSYGRGEESILR